MRKDPILTPPEVKIKEGVITQTRHYKIITALYGGGVEPAKTDPVTVVRATEVRGHLRFWWRATRGGQFGSDLATMKRAEEAIWGSPAAEGKPGPSKVLVTVQVLHKGKIDRPFEVVSGKSGPKVQPRKGSVVPAYAAFPLQPAKENAKVGMETKGVRVGVEFQLHIHFPKKLKDDVEAALWAWEIFGGIGARTRRGFGALQIVSLKQDGVELPLPISSCDTIGQSIHEGLQKHLSGDQWPENVPHLHADADFRITRKERKSTYAWATLIKKLQGFRQWRHKKYGLSLWPEANVIRVRSGASPKWPDNIANPELVEKFPRGKFGLPIIFHMPHDKYLPQDSYTLQGKPEPGTNRPIDRLASPLILRPLACQNGYVGLAVILKTPRVPPYGLEVDNFPEQNRGVSPELSKNEANKAPLNRILDGEPDVLKAFLDYLS